MIKIIKNGDLFNSSYQTLVNPVNCVGVMGKGLALKFKWRFPKMFEYYKMRCSSKTPITTGNPEIYKLSELHDKKQIMLFPTKNDWRKPSQLSFITTGLEAFLQEVNIRSVACPALGCGNGGLPWKVVKPIMIYYFERMCVPVEIYSPKEGKNA